MADDGEVPDSEEQSSEDEVRASTAEEERAEPFVTLPVGPDVGLADVVKAAQALDHDQAAWHAGVIASQAAEVIATAAPGASLANVLESAAEQEGCEGRDQATRLELIAACERMTAYLAGLQASFAQEFLDQRGHGSGALTAVHDELSARLATTSYAAGTIITRAGALAESPRLRAGLAGGEVSARKVDVIAAAVSGLELKERVVIEDYGVQLAPTHTPPQLKKALAAAVIATDPVKAEERHEKEVTQRCVTFEPAAHGMSWLGMYLPAEQGLSIYTCLDAMAATSSADDERGIDARRADAVTGIFSQIMSTAKQPDGTLLPTHHGQSPHLRLSITAPVLAGDEHTPALLHGYGPISAGTARTLAMQAKAEAEAKALAAPAFFKPTTGTGSSTANSGTSAAHEDAGSTGALAAPPRSMTSASNGTTPTPSGTTPSAPSSPTAGANALAAPPTYPAPAERRSATSAAPGAAPSTMPSAAPPTNAGSPAPEGEWVLGGPCRIAPGVLVSLAAHPGATWSERCELAERLGPDATTAQLDAIYGPARPWPDYQTRSEDLAIWRELLDENRHPPGSPTAADSGQSTSDTEWAWACRYLPRFDPMRHLLPPPRPPQLPDGTDAQELIGWTQRHQLAPAGIHGQIEEQLGLSCTDAYAPSRRLRARIIERDQTCRFPTCQVPAWRCQLDHITAFDPALPAWAQTIETNLHALCAHHHQTKTAGLFTVERDPRSGITTWYSPTGHAYTRSPEHADYTAIGHHLRDEYHLTLCEEDPITGPNTDRLDELLTAALPGTPGDIEQSVRPEPTPTPPPQRGTATWPPPQDADPPF